MNKITHERLLEVLDFNPITGVFIWKITDNKKKKGDVAGGVNRRGYNTITIDYVRYQSHRVAWFYVFGKWPENYIDHINGNKSDNRIENLREATNAQNMHNQTKAHKGSKSGLLGAHWHKKSGKWYAIVSGVYDAEAVEQLKSVKNISNLVQWVNEYTNEDESFDKFEVVELL